MCSEVDLGKELALRSQVGCDAVGQVEAAHCCCDQCERLGEAHSRNRSTVYSPLGNNGEQLSETMIRDLT